MARGRVHLRSAKAGDSSTRSEGGPPSWGDPNPTRERVTRRIRSVGVPRSRVGLGCRRLLRSTLQPLPKGLRLPLESSHPSMMGAGDVREVRFSFDSQDVSQLKLELFTGR